MTDPVVKLKMLVNRKSFINQAIRAFSEANDFFDLAAYADKKCFEFSVDRLEEKYAAARNANLTFTCELYFYGKIEGF